MGALYDHRQVLEANRQAVVNAPTPEAARRFAAIVARLRSKHPE